MSIQIGKLLPDGSVRHIKALHETLSKNLVRKFRVFYPNDKRVDALLSLGDIQKLGPSPYGKWTGTGDAVHCFSKIRDGRETPRQSAPRIADNADIFGRMEDTCLLFDAEDGMSWARVAAVRCRPPLRTRPLMTA